MDFVKKHYEKILLGFVLLGLVVALVFLPFMIASDRDQQEQMKEASSAGKSRRCQCWIWRRKQTYWGGCNLLTSWIFPRRISCSIRLNGREPLTDGSLNWPPAMKSAEPVVTKITPLYTMLTLDSDGDQSRLAHAT